MNQLFSGNALDVMQRDLGIFQAVITTRLMLQALRCLRSSKEQLKSIRTRSIGVHFLTLSETA